MFVKKWKHKDQQYAIDYLISHLTSTVLYMKLDKIAPLTTNPPPATFTLLHIAHPPESTEYLIVLTKYRAPQTSPKSAFSRKQYLKTGINSKLDRY